MAKEIKWRNMLSLQQMALRRVTANVWHDFDILSLIQKCQFKQFKTITEDCLDIWQDTVENKVKDKVLKLRLPKSLKKQMIQLVRPMGSCIVKWKNFHERILCCLGEYFDIRILKHLCWTCTGAVDYRNTAEVLVCLKIMNIVNRYKLACLYCLADYIPDLWEQLPKCIQKIFYNGGYSLELMSIDLRYYWAFILNEEDSKLDHLFEGQSTYPPRAFNRLAFKGNKAATEYFFQKLPHEERDSCLSSAVDFISADIYINPKYSLSDFHIADVLSFILSQMSPEQQLEVLKKYPCDILKRFLDWPWQDLFIDIADVIWTFLPEKKYNTLIFLIIANVKHLGYYSPSVVQEFFLRSPRNFKKTFIFWSYSLFSEFFSAEDTETIKVIFRNVDVEDRVKLVSGRIFFKLLDDLVMTDKWYLVELCLQEATLSNEELERLKDTYLEFVTGIDSREIRLRKRNWRKFFQFLDKSNKKVLNKRTNEGEMLKKAKKLCIEKKI